MDKTARFPGSPKRNAGSVKCFFKKATCSSLREEIFPRRKQGFAIPLGQWFRQELKEMTEKTLFDSNDGILDPGFLRKIWDQHQRGHYDRSAHLWSVLMFRKWKETFAA